MKEILDLSEDISKIKLKLSKHVKNPYTFREDSVRVYSEVSFDKETDWSSQNMRRIHFNKCVFDGAVLDSAGFTGSIFNKCRFTKECHLDTTIFDECLFVECEFDNVRFLTCSFCKAELYQTVIRSSFFSKTSHTESHIEKSHFINTEFVDIIWESAVLKNDVFENCIFENLNMEFVNINQTTFLETPLPFSSVPFIFGGLQYVTENADSVRIKTISTEHEKGWMSGTEYADYFIELGRFYANTSNYFPACNILFHYGELKTGIELMESGIEYWSKYANYKMIYYLAKLVDFYSLDITFRKRIFDRIEKINEKIHDRDSERIINRWNEYYIRMRRALLYSEKAPYVTVSISTNIDTQNYEELGLFMQLFETNFLCGCNYFNAELRHNSPFNLFYTVFADPEKLFQIIVGISTIIGAMGTIKQCYDNHIQKAKDFYKKEIDSNQRKMMEQHVTPKIQNIQYNFYNCIVHDASIPENYFTKQSIGCENPLSSGKSQ